MHNIMHNLNEQKLNLNELSAGLEEQYKKYQNEYKDKKENSNRTTRDQEFRELLNQYKQAEKKSEEERIASFYEICKFYVKNVDSGFLGRTPGLIKLIRLPLYYVFSLQTLKLTRQYSYHVFQPSSIDKNGDAADVIKQRLKQELITFCNRFEQFKREEHSFEIG